MTHKHCNKCFLVNCLDTSSCPIVDCSNGCSARMHECKRLDHENICPYALIPCVNANFGCPLKVRRNELSKHLRICPASVTVCSFVFNHEYPSANWETSTEENLIAMIARRDNIWFEHLSECEAEEKEKQMRLGGKANKSKNHQMENVIHSEKYRYITMPPCMLSRGNDAICSACRRHIRQLEEEEDQRLAELNEEERKIMADFNLNFDKICDRMTLPSLVQMSATLINPSDIAKLSLSLPPEQSVTEESEDDPMPIISDIDFPSSFLYRLKYFSSHHNQNSVKSFQKSPRLFCNALCRRDEVEHHWLTHFSVDCVLNTSLIELCPKSQYGCKFQYERMEPCRINGDSIRIRFDQLNDAVTFDWHPNVTNDNHEAQLITLPSEILIYIFQRLDSLSLRNISLVCRRFRYMCQSLLTSHGIVVSEYERNPLDHGDITWIERKKHWLFTNTSSAVPKWRLKSPDKLTSLTQHLVTCPYGETKDLQNEPPYRLHAWTRDEIMITSRLILKELSRFQYTSRLSSSLTSFEPKPEQKTHAIFDRIIRVDHAGELAADRIYAGQMAVLGRTDVGPVIQHMWDEEKAHLAKFNQLIPQYKARPSALLPLWNVAGFALGAGTALLGKEAAMACTVAVEAVIGEHYNNQLRDLMQHADQTKDKDLIETIKKFRDDETNHHDTGLANNAENAPFYQGLTSVIKMGCRLGIYIAERV